MKVVFDDACCVGSGSCARACPEVFELRDDGFLQILQEEPDESLRAPVAQAAELCPTGAITVEG